MCTVITVYTQKGFQLAPAPHLVNKRSKSLCFFFRPALNISASVCQGFLCWNIQNLPGHELKTPQRPWANHSIENCMGIYLWLAKGASKFHHLSPVGIPPATGPCGWWADPMEMAAIQRSLWSPGVPRGCQALGSFLICAVFVWGGGIAIIAGWGFNFLLFLGLFIAGVSFWKVRGGWGWK